MIELITILILAISNVAILVIHILSTREMRLERDKYINALVARNALEFRDLEITSKTEPFKQTPTEPDLVAAEDLTDEEFLKIVGENG